MEPTGMLWAHGVDARPGQQAVLPSDLLTSGTHTIALKELSLPVLRKRQVDTNALS